MTTADQAEPGSDADVAEIQADIERTREQLGETVEALSAKFDVTGRAKQKTAETKDRIAGKTAETKDRLVEKTAVTKDRLAGKTAETKDRLAVKAQPLRSKGAALTSQAKEAITDEEGAVKPAVPVATLVAVAAAVVVIVIWNRRR
jgi:Protein of unknown function (DUF3618)